MEPTSILSNEELQEMKIALEDGNLTRAAEKVSEQLKKIENAPLNIAITGESGTGKSTFVNAIRVMGDEEEGSAKTGVVETTKEPTPYIHPQYPNVTFWDLPGIGTPDFNAKNYLESVKFEKYDFFIIMSSQRFKQNDIDLAKKIKEMNKKFYFVRSKLDSDMYSSKVQKTTFNEEDILEEIRKDCIKKLKDGGITEPQVFLISCLKNQLHKYDFVNMQNTLINELPDHKKHAFLLFLPNFSLTILKKKREALKKEIWKLALISCGVAAVPIPGLSVACDVGILVNALTKYQIAFGLDAHSLETLAYRFNLKVSDLRSVIKSPLVTQKINVEFILALLSKSAAMELMLAEYVVSIIPVIGSVTAGGISFATTYHMLNSYLKVMVEDAERVLKRALQSEV